ncbi:MAG TPA: excalibur calcium-binding domain-containing protein [Mycobacteriales bacterium]|nr:excalibur calcium-binding domain-containing protein [Mycobacteriales bacterium]
MIVGLVVFATAASADTVTGQGTLSGDRYRGGVVSAGGINFGAGVQVNHDPTGEITHVRGVARITKLSNVAAVQVDSVALGTSTTAVISHNTPNNSGAATSVTSYTGWRGVTPKTCTSYRVRANYSIRWTDGGLSKFSVLTPLTRVCGPTTAPVYANCDAMHKVFPHGVGRIGAVDHTTGTRVTTFYVSSWIYNANTARDADKDGIACEKA